MNCLYRSVVKGMENGMSGLGETDTSPGRLGIYNFAPKRAHLCDFYLLHTPLAPDGFFFAPLLEIEYPEPSPERKHVFKRIGAGNTQWLAYDDACRLRRVWINIWHLSESLTGAKDSWIHVEGHFWPQLELDPDDERKTIEERSKELHGDAP